MDKIETLKTKVLVTWDMKDAAMDRLNDAVADFVDATPADSIELSIRRAAAELDYLLREGWHDQYKDLLSEAVEEEKAGMDPMEAEFQQLRDDAGVGE